MFSCGYFGSYTAIAVAPSDTPGTTSWGNNCDPRREPSRNLWPAPGAPRRRDQALPWIFAHHQRTPTNKKRHALKKLGGLPSKKRPTDLQTHPMRNMARAYTPKRGKNKLDTQTR